MEPAADVGSSGKCQGVTAEAQTFSLSLCSDQHKETKTSKTVIIKTKIHLIMSFLQSVINLSSSYSSRYVHAVSQSF